ncbi:MAG TPA: type II secretion system F family protein [Candidatus Saccharimonadales bacterium]|nr:type II secretion system F family protein [Candidatus Saccharimonadales bacterium]
MAQFSYTARTKTGSMQQGTLTATDRAAALASLSQQNLVPVLVKEQKEGGGFGLFKKGRKVKLKDKVIFSRQLATMVNAGVPIVKALTILSEEASESKRLQEALRDATKRVESGGTLADALAQHPDVFSYVYINMVRAGETGGILDEVLERLATQQEKDAEIVGKVRGAMIYPGVISTVAVFAFFFLMTVIVPKLSVIFKDLGGQLPIYTRILLGISNFMTHFWYILIIIMVAIVVTFIRFHATARGKRIVDRVLTKAPIVGPIIIKVNVARFARTFGSLLSSGINVMEALTATKSALKNSLFSDALDEMARAIRNGKSISEPLKNSELFPPIVAQMTLVGEETGKLDEILVKVADFYEREVDTVISSIASIIEPVLIIALGVMIGFIVLSVFGPISQLNNQV